MKIFRLILAASLLQLSGVAVADEEVVLLQGADVMTRPTLLARSSSEHYPSALTRGVESWAVVEVTVRVDDSAVNPLVTNSSIPRIFDQAAMKSATSFTRNPATGNGEAIEYEVEARQVFLIEDNRETA